MSLTSGYFEPDCRSATDAKRDEWHADRFWTYAKGLTPSLCAGCYGDHSELLRDARTFFELGFSAIEFNPTERPGYYTAPLQGDYGDWAEIVADRVLRGESVQQITDLIEALAMERTDEE